MITKNMDILNSDNSEEEFINNEKKIAKEKYDVLPWVEKYRPKTLDEIISHENIILTLNKFIKNKKMGLPHLLFYGPPGTGKTSVIMSMAKQLYGKYYHLMVMELNASDDRGIEVVRNKIKQFVGSKNVFYGENSADRENIHKLVILDETDAMTSDAQAILRKIVENYTHSTRFCLICNYIKKIDPALQSRCTKFRFSPLKNDLILEKTKEIIKKENIIVTDCGLQAILKIAKGDMRKVLNNLQSTSMAYDTVNEKNVNNCSSYPREKQINKILSLLLDKEFEIVYTKIYKMKIEYGLSLSDIINEIHDYLINKILNEGDYKIVQNLTTKQVIYILDKLRDIEYNQSVNTVDDIQLSAIISIFKLALMEK